MLNSGAKLVGQYSMLDQQSYRNPTPHSFRSLKAKLPKSVDNVYFRDRIGNISSSNLRYEKRFSTLEINHRYTLYGGWKNDFEIGYQVPSNEYVVVSKKDKTVHKIEFPFTIPFTVVVIDNLTVKVILPEGATDIHDVLPFQMDNVTEETRFSYLDTTGRPVRVYNKRNVVDFHNQKLMVVYRFTILAILREPFFLFIGFFSALIIFVIFSRINLNLSAPEEFVKIKENSNSSVERKDVNDEADINYNMSLPTKRSAEIAINLITLCEKFQNACKNGIQLGAFSKKHEKQIGQIFESLHLLSKIEKSAIAFCSNLEKLIKAMRKAVAEIDNEKLCKLSTKFEKFVNKLKSA